MQDLFSVVMQIVYTKVFYCRGPRAVDASKRVGREAIYPGTSFPVFWVALERKSQQNREFLVCLWCSNWDFFTPCWTCYHVLLSFMLVGRGFHLTRQ